MGKITARKRGEEGTRDNKGRNGDGIIRREETRKSERGTNRIGEKREKKINIMVDSKNNNETEAK